MANPSPPDFHERQVSINRRHFLSALGASALLATRPFALLAQSATARSKAPYRILYGNDCTNLLSCVSPWHGRNEHLRAEMFTAAVDEAADAGVDAHLFQPGLCWLPWWPSQVLPLEKHVQWFRNRFDPEAKPDEFMQFVLDGGDFVKLTLDRCRKRGVGAFISFRLNDAHNKNPRLDPDQPSTAKIYSTPQFYSKHPEYRLKPQVSGWPSYTQFIHNWAIPEVREFKYRLIEELCQNYDLDGIELDFMRHPYLFHPAQTTREQRCLIMAEFVARVRKLLDQTARGHHRWLGVRIPAYLDTYGAIGIDLPAFADAGVEMFNLSTWYVFEQETDGEKIRAKIPNQALYHELTNTPYTGPALNPKYTVDNYSFRRATDSQLQTTAHLAYSRGFNGVSLFNFVYYRDHAPAEAGPFDEPPFGALQHLADPLWLANRPQEYFLTAVWNEPPRSNRQMGDLGKSPRILAPEQLEKFVMHLSPPARGWKKPALLRLQGAASLPNSIAATFNQLPLVVSDHRGELYPNPHPAQLTGPDDAARSWSVPPSLLRAGRNEIEITVKGRDSVHAIFLSLAAP